MSTGKPEQEDPLPRLFFLPGLMLELRAKQVALEKYQQRAKEVWDARTPQERARIIRRRKVRTFIYEVKEWWIRCRLALVGLSYYYGRGDDLDKYW